MNAPALFTVLASCSLLAGCGTVVTCRVDNLTAQTIHVTLYQKIENAPLMDRNLAATGAFDLGGDSVRAACDIAAGGAFTYKLERGRHCPERGLVIGRAEGEGTVEVILLEQPQLQVIEIREEDGKLVSAVR